MGKNTDHLASRYETENTGGVLTGFLAEEEALDRSALWRLGSGGGATGSRVFPNGGNSAGSAKPGPRSGCVPGRDDGSRHPRKAAHGAPGASRGGGLISSTGNFQCGGDAGDAAHGVEIDHGPTG